jgi:hypothetical protein
MDRAITAGIIGRTTVITTTIITGTAIMAATTAAVTTADTGARASSQEA